MTIFGQNDFLECFHSDSPSISYDLNFLEYYDVRSIEGYPTESFDSNFQNLAKMLHCCHGNMHDG